MTATDERMDRFDARLDAMGRDVSVLKDDVRVLKDDVRVLKDDVKVLKADVGNLKEEVGKLRILYEDHSTQINLIAEVQRAHGEKLEQHGTLLQEIKQDLAPLKDLSDFVRRIAHEHGARLDALETHTRLSKKP